MKRILHVIGAMDRGGAETFIMNLYRVLDREEFQFDFLVHEERVCDYDKEIQDLGGRLYRLPRLSGLNFFKYRRLCRTFFAEHAEHAVVHGHIGSSAAVYLSEAKRAGRYTIAHSHSQNYLKGLPGLAFSALSYPTRYVADYFMACSQEAGIDRFGASIAQGKNFSVVNSGIALQRYACDQAAHEAAQRSLGVDGLPVFGHVGRLSEEKNHQFLFEVFSLIHQQLPQAVLLLAGRGPLEESLKREVRERGLADSVYFLGVSDSVSEVLKAMDVFVFPSRKEGLSLAAVEAQAAGLPVLMSTGVPCLAVVSSRAQRLSLSEGAEAWAAQCVQAYNQAQEQPRRDAVEEVRARGFDSADIAQWLTDFYNATGGQRGEK